MWGIRGGVHRCACPVSVLDADAVAWENTVRTAALEPAGEGQFLSRPHIPLVRFPPVMHLFFKMRGTNQVVTLVLLTYLLSSIITIYSLVLLYHPTLLIIHWEHVFPFLHDLLAHWWLQLCITSLQAWALCLSASCSPQRDSCTHHCTQSCILC